MEIYSYDRRTSSKKMSGVITVLYDFVESIPVNGLDLAVVRVLGKDSFGIGKKILTLNQLMHWLGAQNTRDPHPILHLLIKEFPSAEVLSKLEAAFHGDIFIHFE
jgi:hypothetical protein